MPIDAILFGGRRATNVPLVREAFDWEHGVFMGSIMSSETTAAASGDVGKLRYDPFAMLPFCGYHMGDYFAPLAAHRCSEGDASKLPRLFHVNWFRKDDDGNFLWPGFGENSRVLAWIFRRCEGTAEAVETPAGLVPGEGAIDTTGLDVSAEDMAELLRVDPERPERGAADHPRALRPVRRPPAAGAAQAARGARAAAEVEELAGRLGERRRRRP